MTDKKDMAETLRSVRQSYYFLHQFQLRLRDTIERFRKEFGDMKFSFSRSLLRDNPVFKSDPHTDKYQIDLFPAYYYTITYEILNQDKPPMLFEIVFHVDTEFYDVEADEFPADEKDSLTRLKVYFWMQTDIEAADFNWRNMWNAADDYPEAFDKNSDGEGVDKYKKLGVKCMGVWLNLEDLLDEQSISNEAGRVKALVKENLGYAFDGAS